MPCAYGFWSATSRRNRTTTNRTARRPVACDRQRRRLRRRLGGIERHRRPPDVERPALQRRRRAPSSPPTRAHRDVAGRARLHVVNQRDQPEEVLLGRRPAAVRAAAEEPLDQRRQRRLRRAQVEQRVGGDRRRPDVVAHVVAEVVAARARGSAPCPPRARPRPSSSSSPVTAAWVGAQRSGQRARQERGAEARQLVLLLEQLAGVARRPGIEQAEHVAPRRHGSPISPNSRRRGRRASGRVCSAVRSQRTPPSKIACRRGGQRPAPASAPRARTRSGTARACRPPRARSRPRRSGTSRSCRCPPG